MSRILNLETNTVHEATTEQSSRTTRCGSLAHVPDARTRVVSDEAVRTDAGLERCGSCFDDAGGY